MTRQVLRWEVPIDDEWHVPPFLGSIIHVAARDPRAANVEIWTTQDTSVSYVSTGTGRVVSESVVALATAPNEREFRVFGTGQPVEGQYHGTALIGPFAWHLYSRLPEVST